MAYITIWGGFILKENSKIKIVQSHYQQVGVQLILKQSLKIFELGFTHSISNKIFQDSDDLVQVEYGCKIPCVINKDLETD